jgi:hypothetical protein
VTRAARREVRELRRQVRDWRRGRADTTLMEVLSDAYIAGLAVVMLSAMAISAIHQTRLSISASCTTSECSDARFSSAWVGILAVLALTLTVARAVGPVQVTPAEGSWLLATPADRGSVLRPRLALVAVVASLTAAGVGALASVLAGFDLRAVGLITLWVTAGGIGAAMFAVLTQSGQGWPARVVTWVLGGGTWVGLVLIAVSAVPSAPGTGPWDDATGVALAGAATLAAVASLVGAVRSLPRLHRDRLVPGGALLASLSGALASLDLALTYDILVARRWLARATVRPVRSGPKGALALAWRDVIRLRRSPAALLVLIGAVVVPYLVLAIDLGPLVVLTGAFAMFVTGLPLCSALRTTSRNPGLIRCFPMSAVRVRSACLAVPAGVLVLWSAAASPAVHAATSPPSWTDSALMSLGMAMAALTAIARWLLAPPPDYSKMVVSSPAGGIPAGLAWSLLRGLDVLVLLTAPILISPTGNGALVSLALGAIVLPIIVRRD